MITDMILAALVLVPFTLLNSMPIVNIVIPDVNYQPLLSAINSIGRIMPVKELLPILVIEAVLSSAKILWAIVIRVKSFIPTMGD